MEKYSALTGAMVYPQREVVALDPAGKKATAKNLRTGAEEVYEYDACIVAVGASPAVPPLPGLNADGQDHHVCRKQSFVRLHAFRSLLARHARWCRLCRALICRVCS